MGSLTRRGAIGFGVMCGSAFLTSLGRSAAADEKEVIVAGEKAVLFKIRDVTVARVDQAVHTITVSFGCQDNRTELANLPLGADIRIRASFVRPGSVNHVPFDWERLKGLVGERVSLMLRAEASRLTVDSIAVAND